MKTIYVIKKENHKYDEAAYTTYALAKEAADANISDKRYTIEARTL